jgi:hypothetical protein
VALTAGQLPAPPVAKALVLAQDVSWGVGAGAGAGCGADWRGRRKRREAPQRATPDK